MNRKAVIIAIALAATSMSACTPRQIAAAVALQTERAAEPTLEVQATCAGLTITTTGWPEGSDGLVGFGAEPPGVRPANGTVERAASQYDQGQIGWVVIYRGPDVEPQQQDGMLDCGPELPPAESPAPIP